MLITITTLEEWRKIPEWAASLPKMMSRLFVGKSLPVGSWEFKAERSNLSLLGWDYMIGNSETAYNKVASLVMGLKESILEEKERKKEDRNWKLIGLRVLSNFL